LTRVLAIHWPLSKRREKPMSERAVGGVALVTSTLAGSTYNSFAKPLTGIFSPLSLLFVSELLTSFFVVLSFGVVPTVKEVLKLKREHVIPLLAVGLLSSVIGPMLWFLSLSMTSAVNASLFGKVDLVIMMLLARFMLRERLTRAHVLAVAVVVAGLICVALRGFTDVIEPRFSDLTIVLSCFSFAMGGILFRKYLTHVEAHVALFVRTLVAIGMFFVLSPFVTTPFIAEIESFPLALIPTLIGFGFISRFINIFAYYQAVDRLPVMTVSLFTTLDTIGGTLFAFWHLGEPVYWYHLVGGACIVCGNLLLEFAGTHSTEEHKVRHMKLRVSHRP
jgi:drug/metabolite transporter (DMT)-like permease